MHPSHSAELLRDDDESVGSEMLSLSGSGGVGRSFDQIPLSDQRGINDDDDDAVLGRRSSLHASLTRPGTESHTSSGLRARLAFWCEDPKNQRSKRCLQILGGVLALLFAIVMIAAYARHTDDDPNQHPFGVRLPTSVQPTHYTLQLNASLSAERYTGQVDIELLFTASTTEIVFHAVDLDIRSVQLTVPSTTPGAPDSITFPDSRYVLQHDLYVVSLPFFMRAGRTALLSLEFAGVISPDSLAGFYMSTYTTSTGEHRKIASTQFEAVSARRAFPCFDEPAFKANFTIILVTEDRYPTLLSNMPPSLPQAEQLPYGMQRVVFDTTPRMSTYLLAWVICDFTSIEGTTERGVPVRVWAAPEQIAAGQGQVALAAALASLNRFDSLFQLPYPLPKSDQVAIPNFAAGAMENWGLVTYRDTALLVPPSDADREANAEQQVVTTVAHELAHQWFGDIVTMQWWNDLWLNEGFASFVEWIGMGAYNAHWDQMGQMVVSTQATALALDSSQYSHPIVQRVNDPNEIEGLFDSIAYDKGASILFMLADILGFYDGETSFQQGLQAYLQKHAYGNAASADLWAALQSAAPSDLGVSIPVLMAAFTEQMGYPLVTLTYDPSRPQVLRATQARFLELPYDMQDPSLRDQQSAARWELSIRYEAQGQTPPGKVWLRSTDTAGVDIPFMEGADWLYANVGRAGFYRVNYVDGSPAAGASASNPAAPCFLWTALALELREEEPPFTNADLAGMLDDVWALAWTGHTAYANAFNITAFLGILPDYPEYTPWAAAFTQLGRVKSVLSASGAPHHRAAAVRFDRYVQRLVNSNVLSLPPWSPIPAGDGSGHPRALLQQLFVSSLVAYGDPVARGNARELWDAFVLNGTSVPADIRDAVYRVGIEEGGDAAWHFLFQRYNGALDGGEARRILRALARSANPAQLTGLLDMIVNSTVIKLQDQTRVLLYTSLNPAGKLLAWQWLQRHWSLLFQRFGSASFSFGELVSRVVGQMSTQAEMTEAQQFFKDKDMGTAALALKQAYERVQGNIFFLRDRFNELDAELAARV